jgi:hypothetical protein
VSAYLIDHPGVLRQYSARTSWAKSRPTGLIVLHTSENVMDSVGPDTGTDVLARFIQSRSTPGSYHSIADSDSNLDLVPFEYGAWQDGTGSNGFALSISFVCRTVDWDRMTTEQRRGFLRQGALAFVRQQKWLKANDYPATPLRLVSKADSDRGAAGFIYHGHRDPGRRSDPGVAPPNDFPLAEFFEACRAALGGGTKPVPVLQEEEVMRIVLVKPSYTPYLLSENGSYRQIDDAYRDALVAVGVKEYQVSEAQHQEFWNNRPAS